MRQGNLSCLVLSLAILALVAPAQAADFASMSSGSEQITFSATASNIRLVLTVAGGDYFDRQAVDNGTVVFSAAGLADGFYNWELRAEPILSAGEREALAEARQSGDYSVVAKLQLPQEEMVRSGTFRIVNGAMVVPMGDEKPFDTDNPTKDIVHLDDVIIDGSLCVGQDCVNGESFGFDTIRLKENNLRIKFQDTSNSASFPTNDWQITANDSSNGGANKFSIDDIDGGRTPFTIEASAPSHSLYVDDGGRLGFGTSTPVVDLHVKTGNTPTLRLEQDGSSGFTAQSWDVAGNEANFFIRDVTNGSTLPFRIRPGAPTSAIDVAADGDVGIGTSSPSGILHIRKPTANADLFFETNNRTWKFRNNYATQQFTIINENDGFAPVKIDEAAPTNSLVIESTGIGINTATPNASAALDVYGAIYQSGSVLHADYVFEDDYQLESIEEHAEFMWANKHLPAVAPRTVTEDGVEQVDIGAHRRGILEELEKAHIYIEQLSVKIQQLEQEMEQLKAE